MKLEVLYCLLLLISGLKFTLTYSEEGLWSFSVSYEFIGRIDPLIKKLMIKHLET